MKGSRTFIAVAALVVATAIPPRVRRRHSDAFGIPAGHGRQASAPGPYELAVSVTDPFYGNYEDGITFFVDAASCL